MYLGLLVGYDTITRLCKLDFWLSNTVRDALKYTSTGSQVSSVGQDIIHLCFFLKENVINCVYVSHCVS